MALTGQISFLACLHFLGCRLDQFLQRLVLDVRRAPFGHGELGQIAAKLHVGNVGLIVSRRIALSKSSKSVRVVFRGLNSTARRLFCHRGTECPHTDVDGMYFLVVDFFYFNLRGAGRDQVSGRTQAKTDESAMRKREKGDLVSGEKEGRKGITEV